MTKHTACDAGPGPRAVAANATLQRLGGDFDEMDLAEAHHDEWLFAALPH